MTDEELIAWHEVTHGRMSEMVGGWPVIGMEVNADDGSGFTEFDIQGADDLTDLNDQELDAYMSVCAAGQAGEMYYYVQNGYSYDDANDMASVGSESDQEDFAETAQLLGDGDWDSYVKDAYTFAEDNNRLLAADVAALADNSYQLDQLPEHDLELETVGAPCADGQCSDGQCT